MAFKMKGFSAFKLNDDDKDKTTADISAEERRKREEWLKNNPGKNPGDYLNPIGKIKKKNTERKFNPLAPMSD